MNKNKTGFANSVNASLGESNCKNMAAKGINKLVKGKGMDSVIHKIATMTSKAKAYSAFRLSKIGKNKRIQKTVMAINIPVRFILLVSTLSNFGVEKSLQFHVTFFQLIQLF